jgi:hypothetical protein
VGVVDLDAGLVLAGDLLTMGRPRPEPSTWLPSAR